MSGAGAVSARRAASGRWRTAGTTGPGRAWTARSASWPSSCRSAGRPCRGISACSRRPGWWPIGRRARAGSTASTTRASRPCGSTWRTSGGSGGPVPASRREHQRADRTGDAVTEPVEPIVIEFEVACSPGHAFDTWANRTSLWWPPSHSMTSAPAGLSVASGHRPRPRHRGRHHLHRRRRRHHRHHRPPRLGAPRRRRPGLAPAQPGWLERAAPPLPAGDSATRRFRGPPNREGSPAGEDVAPVVHSPLAPAVHSPLTPAPRRRLYVRAARTSAASTSW